MSKAENRKIAPSAEPPRSGLYGPSWYKLDEGTLTQLRTLQPHKPILAALVNWIWIFAIVKSYLHWGGPALYPVVIFLIAGRAGVFLQLAHEAGHGLISRGRFNDWFGDWVATYPIGLDLNGYRTPHMHHHACVNQVCDPISDKEKYRVTDIRDPKLWLLFVKDILGITAVSIRFMYDRPETNTEASAGELEKEPGTVLFSPSPSGGRLEALKKYASIGFVQLLILGALFNLRVDHYLLLWIVPLVTAHMVLMRVRGIAEHGLGIQLGVKDLAEKNRGTLFTRSFGTEANAHGARALLWLERFLIGSLDVYYHHEHHLFPKVPYYNLSKIHALVSERVAQNNPYVYAKGYFSCLFFNLRRPRSTPAV